MLPVIPVVLGLVGLASRAIGAGMTVVNKVTSPSRTVKAVPPGIRAPKSAFGKLMARSVYALCFIMLMWEVVGRMVIIPILCPELLLRLPPSMLDTVLDMLLTLSVE